VIQNGGYGGLTYMHMILQLGNYLVVEVCFVSQILSYTYLRMCALSLGDL